MGSDSYVWSAGPLLSSPPLALGTQINNFFFLVCWSALQPESPAVVGILLCLTLALCVLPRV